MNTNPSTTQNLDVEFYENEKVYTANHVVALIEPQPVPTPPECEYKYSDPNLKAFLPFIPLLKTTPFDEIAINVYLLGDETIVTVARNPNVPIEYYAESMGIYRQYLDNLEGAIWATSKLDLSDEKDRQEAYSYILRTVVLGCEDRIVNCIANIQTFLMNHGQRSEYGYVASPVFQIHDLTEDDRFAFVKYVKDYTGIPEWEVALWLEGCLEELMEFDTTRGFRQMDSDSTLHQQFRRLSLVNSSRKGNETRQEASSQRETFQQMGDDVTPE
ncbi:hypothetical protein TWF481_007604 [Arthrobotrys musiformis]|uniref:Uncharacterized protein n=1 Tax=Arthrobotrys musiformis TaxID=47236 RepID=A0AAV9WHP8_9PEZI